jgi:hypothetical protein
MPKFTYEDTQSGKTLTLDRETEPSESELNQLFAVQQPAAQQPAAKLAEQPITKPATVPDSAMQFLPQAAPASQRVPAAELEVMSGGFPAAPQAPLPKRPTQTDAIRKAVELSMGGAFGVPTVSQISQIYFNMQNEYERAIKPVDKSERDKAFEIGMSRFMFENKRKPDPKEMDMLYKQAATVGTRELSEGGLVMDQGGNFSGVYFTNNATGDVLVKPPGENLRPIKSGEIPATPGSFTPHIQFSEFKKLKTELQDDEESLRRMQKYASLSGSIPSGFNKLAEDFKFAYNTLMGDPATSEQINIQLAKGQLQGLVSGLRTTVGGGGTMTEGDVSRIIDYLGGRVNSLQNPEVVKRAIANMYSEKAIRYNDNINTYNFSVVTKYGRPGSPGAVYFKEKTPMDLDKSLLEGSLGLYGVPSSLEEKEKRAAELRAKKGSK